MSVEGEHSSNLSECPSADLDVYRDVRRVHLPQLPTDALADLALGLLELHFRSLNFELVVTRLSDMLFVM